MKAGSETSISITQGSRLRVSQSTLSVEREIHCRLPSLGFGHRHAGGIGNSEPVPADGVLSTISLGW